MIFSTQHLAPLVVIGHVRNSTAEMIDKDWGAVTSEIVLLPEYTAGLQGLEQFSHVLIVYWMHQAEYEASRHLLRRPRDRDDLPLTGIFAQRAKHRPNPIGITAVPLISVAADRIHVRGLDAVDGTPVLDVKPYFPHYDRVDESRTADWVQVIMQEYF